MWEVFFEDALPDFHRLFKELPLRGLYVHGDLRYVLDLQTWVELLDGLLG